MTLWTPLPIHISLLCKILLMSIKEKYTKTTTIDQPYISRTFFPFRLDVRSNNIAGKGLCALTDAMKMNQTLTHIFIWGNKLEESAAIVSSTFLMICIEKTLLLFVFLKVKTRIFVCLMLLNISVNSYGNVRDIASVFVNDIQI